MPANDSPIPAPIPAPPLLESVQVLSVDILRGVILVVMALDHTRDYFTNLPFEPEDIAHSWGALFLTRWITHFCAPLFSFLAGTGAYLSLSGGKSKSQISRFLLTRGLWLVDYLLMTLGPGLIALAAFDRRTALLGAGPVMRFLLVFGRVPMFFYLCHIYAIRLLAILVAWLAHQPVSWLIHGAMFFNAVPPAYGHALPFVYLMWFIVISLLYLPCRSYAGLKARRKDWWLSYL